MREVKEYAFDLEANINEVSSYIEVISGGLLIFDELLQDMEKSPEMASKLVNQGVIQVKLLAIFMLFRNSIEKMKKANNNAYSNVEPIFKYFVKSHNQIN
ncbi:hypothetical protein [Pseudogracilibacillus sp. SO30301A]|uniref:hypothetical protein n=1 Tax=Pseudogracilibacillus sp. SO30301A TaxID=3098291 RepID=UPI00300DF232